MAAKVRAHIGEISHAAGEQASGVGQINDAVASLDQNTQHNAALAEELSAASRMLLDRAASLRASVKVFQLGRLRRARVRRQPPVPCNATCALPATGTAARLPAGVLRPALAPDACPRSGTDPSGWPGCGR